MMIKTMVEWNTGNPPGAGWYNTLIINDRGIPEVMTMKWDKENRWDNPSWEVKGWCPFPLTCEFVDEDSEEPVSPGNHVPPVPEENILWLADNLLETFSEHISDGALAGTMAKQIVLEYIRNGGTHADK